MDAEPSQKDRLREGRKRLAGTHPAETASDAALLAAHPPQPGTSVVVYDEMVKPLTPTSTPPNTLDIALAADQVIPARLPLAKVNPGQQVLDTETQLIHDAIRIAACRHRTVLACAIVTDTGYTGADDEAHSLTRTALAGSGDIIPDTATNTLHVRLDPLPAPRHTVAIDELCRVLNDTHTVYPGTDLTLRYSIKSHQLPRTNY